MDSCPLVNNPLLEKTAVWQIADKQKRRSMSGVFVKLERETRLELATPTLARSCSTN